MGGFQNRGRAVNLDVHSPLGYSFIVQVIDVGYYGVRSAHVMILTLEQLK